MAVIVSKSIAKNKEYLLIKLFPHSIKIKFKGSDWWKMKGTLVQIVLGWILHISRHKSHVFRILDFAFFLGQNMKNAQSSVIWNRWMVIKKRETFFPKIREWLFEIGELLFEIGEQLFQVKDGN